MQLDWDELGPKTIYLNRYLSLIEKYKYDEKVKGDWLERHHIYPKAIFGENALLVILDIRTHILAHELLWRHLKKIKSKYAHKMGLVMARMAGVKKNQYDMRDVKFSSRQLAISRIAMHEAMKGENNPFYGKKHSAETRLKISDARAGVPLSESHKVAIGVGSKETWSCPILRKAASDRMKLREITQITRDKISKAKKGNIVLQEVRDKISRANKGKLLGITKTETHKEKISKALTGKKKTEDHINKINKNPEKIRKTAEKHQGMKRSEETKQRISASKRGKPAPNKGKVFYCNAQTGERIFISPSDIIPDGFTKGDPSIKGKVGGAGKLWWYDSINNVKGCFLPGEQPPGWLRGKPLEMPSVNRKNE